MRQKIAGKWARCRYFFLFTSASFIIHSIVNLCYTTSRSADAPKKWRENVRGVASFYFFTSASLFIHSIVNLCSNNSKSADVQKNGGKICEMPLVFFFLPLRTRQ
jgi:hypothetical protein